MGGVKHTLGDDGLHGHPVGHGLHGLDGLRDGLHGLQGLCDGLYGVHRLGQRLHLCLQHLARLGGQQLGARVQVGGS